MSFQGHNLDNLVALAYPMLHTKFQSHWSTGSGVEDFFKVLCYFWDSSHVGHVTKNNFAFLKALETVNEIWLQLAQLFQRNHLKL